MTEKVNINNFYSKNITLKQDIKRQELENKIMFKILKYLRDKMEKNNGKKVFR